MAIKDSIDNLLIKLNGTAILEDVYKWLEGKYSRETIQRFLKNNRNEYEIQANYIVSEDLQIESFIEKLRDSINIYNPLSEEVFRIMISKFINEFKSFIGPEKLDDKIKNLKNGDKQFLKEAEHLFFELDYQFYFEKDKRYRFSSRLFNFLLSNGFKYVQATSTPESLNQLIAELLSIGDGARIYNPTAGYLNLAAAINIETEIGVKIKASEINQKIYKYGQLFAEINELNVDYSCVDSAREIVELSNGEFDFIVSHLPFQVKSRQPSYSKKKYRDLAYQIISESLGKLNNKGKAVYIVPDNILFSSDKESKMFRKEIVESHTLKSIISLPANLFAQASVKGSILVFDKEMFCNSIQFIDATSKEYYDVKGDKTVSLKVDKVIAEYQKIESNPIISEPAVQYSNNIASFTVPVSVVRDTDYYLNFGRYLVDRMEFEEGYVPLRNILTPLRLAKFTREESISLSPFIRISELNADIIDSAKNLDQNTSWQQGRLLDKPAILIGKVGGSFKPTWFNASFEVEVSNNIAVLDYDEKKVFVPYLIQELNADYVYTQMKLLATGIAIQHLSNEDLLSVKVRFPELRSEQEQLYNERIRFSRDQKLKQKPEIKTISDAELFKTFKHEIGNILKAPEGFLDLLPDFLEQNFIKPETPFVKMEGSESIQQMIELSRDRINRVYAVMENMKGILFSDEKYFKPKNIELKSFIEDCLTRESINENFQWYVTINGSYLSHKKVFAEIDTSQFEYLVRNMASNALEHSKREEILHFIVDIVDLKESTLIDFMNDGEPLPSNLNLENFIHFGKRSGDSKGQGLGGFLISQVVNNHNGVLDILPAGKNIKVARNKRIQANVHFSISIPKDL